MKTIEAYFVFWNGVPQMGMWAPTEEELQDLIDDYFSAVKDALRDDSDNWTIRTAQIVFD